LSADASREGGNIEHPAPNIACPPQLYPKEEASQTKRPPEHIVLQPKSKFIQPNLNPPGLQRFSDQRRTNCLAGTSQKLFDNDSGPAQPKQIPAAHNEKSGR